jgi:hypothetical protein
MHPSDNIQETLWLFHAKIKCFSNNSISRKYEEYNLLKSCSNNVIKYTDIEFISMK